MTDIEIKRSDIEANLNAEYEAWFKRLQALTDEVLDINDWTGRWYDGYTPEHALKDGPEDNRIAL